MHGSPLSCLARECSGSSLWLPAAGIDASPRCPSKKRHHFFLVCNYTLPVVIHSPPIWTCSPPFIHFVFFLVNSGKKKPTCERGAICHSLPLNDLLLSVYPSLHQPEVVRKNLASSSSPTLLALAQSEVSKDKNEERLEITGLK